MNSTLPAIDSTHNFAWLVGQLVGLINAAVPVLGALALVIFFYGLIRFIYSSYDTHVHTDGYKFIVWGLVAIFVLFCVWGIIRLFQESIFPSSALSTTALPGIIWPVTV